jgi:hypothetical protein
MLVAVAMAIVVAIPAGAAKPDKPGKPDEPTPTLFEVTFAFANDDKGGFSTENEVCTTGTSITMKAGPGGRLYANGEVGTDVPLLYVNLPLLEWGRDYPYYPDAESANAVGFDPTKPHIPTAGSGLTGCHGGGIDVLVDKTKEPEEPEEQYPRVIEQYPGFLMLKIRDGSVDFRWEADYYRESELTESTESKNPRKNQEQEVTTAWEGFSYLDSQLAWTGNWDTTTEESTGDVTGEINVEYFNYLGGREPFSGSPVDVDFEMTITPASE